MSSSPTSNQARAVGFLQSGTGAIAETLQGRGRRAVLITDFMSDAQRADILLATPTVDTTAAIQAAHDALPTSGGQLIHPGGRALVAGNLTFTKRVQFIGTGTLEDETATPPCALIKKSTATGTLLTFTGLSSIMQGIACVGETGNTGDGIQIKANGITLRDVAALKMGSNGIRIGHSDTTNCNSWMLDNCRARENGNDGVYVHSDDAGGTINANGGTAINLSCQNNNAAGLHLKNAQKNSFIGCHTENNATYGVQLESAAGCQLNVFVGGDQEGNTTADVFVGTNAAKNSFIEVGILTTFTNNSATTLIVSDAGLQLHNFGTVGTGTIGTRLNKWYEEGTFTPQLFLGATELSAQGTPGTYGVQIGRYRRSGNWVDFTVNVTLTATGAGGAGTLSIGNLPYLAKNLSNYFPALPLLPSEIAFTGHLACAIGPNERRIYPYSIATTGARTFLTETALEATSSFVISGCYECDDNG